MFLNKGFFSRYVSIFVIIVPPRGQLSHSRLFNVIHKIWKGERIVLCDFRKYCTTFREINHYLQNQWRSSLSTSRICCTRTSSHSFSSPPRSSSDATAKRYDSQSRVSLISAECSAPLISILPFLFSIDCWAPSGACPANLHSVHLITTRKRTFFALTPPSVLSRRVA